MVGNTVENVSGSQLTGKTQNYFVERVTVKIQQRLMKSNNYSLLQVISGPI